MRWCRILINAAIDYEIIEKLWCRLNLHSCDVDKVIFDIKKAIYKLPY